MLFYPEDGCSTFLWDVSKFLADYTVASQKTIIFKVTLNIKVRKSRKQLVMLPKLHGNCQPFMKDYNTGVQMPCTNCTVKMHD
jgi:hypothetical protein